jgi:hypothetical protein
MTKPVEGEVITPRPRLTQKQERFAQLYATEREFFGNGVASYIEAYNPSRIRLGWYEAACSSASRLLSNVKVCRRINELLEEAGLNDQNVDKQLAFLVTQHSDFKTKLGAIREYNKMKKRVNDAKGLVLNVQPVAVMEIKDGDKQEATTDSGDDTKQKG